MKTNPKADAIRRWLLDEGRGMGGTRELLDAFCNRLVEAGVPVGRVLVSIRVIHPQILATAYVWKKGGELVTTERGHDVLNDPMYLNSPIKLIYEGEDVLRRKLEGPDAQLDLPILRDLHDQGATDYLALGFDFTDGTRHGMTFTSFEPGGFNDLCLSLILDVLPVLSLLLEIRSSRRVATTLLDTYVGHQAGERILRGEIQRGMGQTIGAVILYSDLRGFTAMSDALPTGEVIDVLNTYFEHMTEAIDRHGGQVLKFIGDGILAIFPLGDAAFRHYACRQALTAAIEAEEAIDVVNEERRATGQPVLRYGVALHVGDVVFGNIGAPNRLDFTAIGPAVNLTSRLDNLASALDVPVILSADFAETARENFDLVSLGKHALRGLPGKQEVFTLPEKAPQKARVKTAASQAI